VALLLAAPRAQAELVTHQFTGQLTTITNGSGNLLDLTGVFTLGQAVTLEYTIERDTPPVQQDAYTSAYPDAITALAFSIDTWSGSGTPSSSSTTVSNDAPSPAPRGPWPSRTTSTRGRCRAASRPRPSATPCCSR
jgi:hypothetical protein